jgi:hypothetical protein
MTLRIALIILAVMAATVCWAAVALTAVHPAGTIS